MATTDAAGLSTRPAAGLRRVPRVSLSAVFLAVLALIVVLPLLQIAWISLQERTAVLNPNAPPGGLSLRAYAEALTGLPFPRYFLNSLFVTLAVTVGSTLTAILAAYVFARATFPGRDALFLIVIGTLMIPEHITLIPNYLTFAKFGALDSYTALILPFLSSGFSVFFLRQFMMGIPRSLDEAARCDGAGPWTILWTIIVPLSWPAISVVALFAFIGQFNAYIWPLLSTTSEDMRTLQIGLRYLIREEGEGAAADWPLVMAGAMIVLAPLLIAFAVAERHLIRGITMGSFR